LQDARAPGEVKCGSGTDAGKSHQLKKLAPGERES